MIGRSDNNLGHGDVIVNLRDGDDETRDERRDINPAEPRLAEAVSR